MQNSKGSNTTVKSGVLDAIVNPLLFFIKAAIDRKERQEIVVSVEDLANDLLSKIKGTLHEINFNNRVNFGTITLPKGFYNLRFDLIEHLAKLNQPLAFLTCALTTEERIGKTYGSNKLDQLLEEKTDEGERIRLYLAYALYLREQLGVKRTSEKDNSVNALMNQFLRIFEICSESAERVQHINEFEKNKVAIEEDPYKQILVLGAFFATFSAKETVSTLGLLSQPDDDTNITEVIYAQLKIEQASADEELNKFIDSIFQVESPDLMVAALPYLFDTLDKDLLISFENEMKLEISAISVAINLSRQDDISKSLKLYSKALETGKEIIGLAGLIHSLVLDIKKLEISDENKKAIASIVSQIPDEDRKPQSDWFKPRSISPRASETQDSNINNSNIPN